MSSICRSPEPATVTRWGGDEQGQHGVGEFVYFLHPAGSCERVLGGRRGRHHLSC